MTRLCDLPHKPPLRISLSNMQPNRRSPTSFAQNIITLIDRPLVADKRGRIDRNRTHQHHIAAAEHRPPAVSLVVVAHAMPRTAIRIVGLHFRFHHIERYANDPRTEAGQRAGQHRQPHAVGITTGIDALLLHVIGVVQVQLRNDHELFCHVQQMHVRVHVDAVRQHVAANRQRQSAEHAQETVSLDQVGDVAANGARLGRPVICQAEIRRECKTKSGIYTNSTRRHTLVRLQLDFDQFEWAGQQRLCKSGGGAGIEHVIHLQVFTLTRRFAAILQEAHLVAVNAEHQRIYGAGRPQREHDAAIEAVDLRVIHR